MRIDVFDKSYVDKNPDLKKTVGRELVEYGEEYYMFDDDYKGPPTLDCLDQHLYELHSLFVEPSDTAHRQS
jgi:hypothetical protein